MNFTKAGIRAISSDGFKEDVRRVVREINFQAAVVFAATVACANDNGVFPFDPVAIGEVVRKNHDFLVKVVNEAVGV